MSRTSFKKLIKIGQGAMFGMMILTISSLFALSVFSPKRVEAYTPSCTGASCKFVFLAPLPIDGITPANAKEKTGGDIDLGGEGATQYVKNLYIFGVAVAAGLAVIMIVVGGIEMSTVDAMSGKIDGGGRKKINAALSGLALALLSYLILSTVNVNLLSANFVPKVIDADPNIGFSVNPTITVRPGQPIASGMGGQGYVSDGTAAQRLNDAALGKLGVSTCNISGTNGGRLACAYAVNAIVFDALGKPITGSNANYGKSTSDMYAELSGSDRFYLVASNATQAKPGDIVISPTQGSNTGHVGIFTTSGKIISNSSSEQQVDDKFSLDSWQNYYSGNKGLSTYVFRPR